MPLLIYEPQMEGLEAIDGADFALVVQSVIWYIILILSYAHNGRPIYYIRTQIG